MACPKCGCKLHYQYDGGAGWCDYLGDGEIQTDLQRCAACGEVFDIEDSTDDDDGAADGSTKGLTP